MNCWSVGVNFAQTGSWLRVGWPNEMNLGAGSIYQTL